MKLLPERIALEKAVKGQRQYQGKIEIKQMSRLLDLIASNKGVADFSIYFERKAGLLGKAQVTVNADITLLCTISHKEFIFPVEIDSTIGFIDDLAYEDLLDVNMEASWVEDGMINPLEIIEDELVLAIPDAPFDESINDDPEIVLESISKNALNKVAEEKPNPFDVLKNLK